MVAKVSTYMYSFVFFLEPFCLLSFTGFAQVLENLEGMYLNLMCIWISSKCLNICLKLHSPAKLYDHCSYPMAIKLWEPLIGRVATVYVFGFKCWPRQVFLKEKWVSSCLAYSTCSFAIKMVTQPTMCGLGLTYNWTLLESQRTLTFTSLSLFT